MGGPEIDRPTAVRFDQPVSIAPTPIINSAHLTFLYDCKMQVATHRKVAQRTDRVPHLGLPQVRYRRPDLIAAGGTFEKVVLLVGVEVSGASVVLGQRLTPGARRPFLGLFFFVVRHNSRQR